MEDLERLRLRKANELVSEVKGSAEKDKFLQVAERLTSLLMSNGLLLTVAYLQKKGAESEKKDDKSEKKDDKSEKRILEFITNWIKERGLIQEKEGDLLSTLLNLDYERLPLIFDEVVSMAEALKIVAGARLK